MKSHPKLAVALLALCPFFAKAESGLCTNDADVRVTIQITERGQVTDLSVKVPQSPLTRYPEANGRMVILPTHAFGFSAKETPMHEAMTLDISDKSGQLKLGGKTSSLQCDWN